MSVPPVIQVWPKQPPSARRRPKLLLSWTCCGLCSRPGPRAGLRRSSLVGAPLRSLRLQPLGLRILWPGPWFPWILYFCFSVKYCYSLVPFPLHDFLVGNLKESERNACPWFSIFNQSSGGFLVAGQQACPSLTTGIVLPSEHLHVLGTFHMALLAFWASGRA